MRRSRIPVIARHSTCARIWRRYSRGSKDIRRFSQDMGADEGGKSFEGDQLDRTTQQSLEQVRESHEAIEALLPGGKLHEEIHVAGRPRLAPRHRAKERKAPHTEPADLRFCCAQAFDRALPGRR